MKKGLLILLLILGNIAILQSQSIKIVRSDVDSARTGFITAGYVFGFDVYLDSLTKTNGISFELQWDTPQYIHFSQWKIGDIGPKAQALVSDKIDQNAGHIYATVGTGLPLDSSVIINSKLLRLEFVLLQTAPDGNKVTFKFIKPTATAIVDSIPKVINLNAENVVFNFHGMVDVYPGDADNSGTVDQSDFTQTLFYLGMGPLTKSVKTFKRQYASAFWTAQKCLRWDIAPATYADCDGNGEINMDDLLIVSYNLNKTQKPSIPQIEQQDSNETILQMVTDGNLMPIALSADKDFISVAIEMKIKSEQSSKIKSIQPSSVFGSNSYVHYKLENDKINLIIGSKDNKIIHPNQQNVIELFNLVLDEVQSIDYQITSARAINQFGEIFDITSPTNINFVSNENNNDKKVVNITYQNHQLFVNLLGEYIGSLSLVDLNGNTVKSINYDEQTDNVNLDLIDIAPQIYFVTIKTTSGKYFAEPIVLVK